MLPDVARIIGVGGCRLISKIYNGCEPEITTTASINNSIDIDKEIATLKSLSITYRSLSIVYCHAAITQQQTTHYTRPPGQLLSYY